MYGKFTDNPEIPPPPKFRKKRDPVPMMIQQLNKNIIMYPCPVHDCGFRTPRPAVLEKHMSYHTLEQRMLSRIVEIPPPVLDMPASVDKPNVVIRKPKRPKRWKGKGKRRPKKPTCNALNNKPTIYCGKDNPYAKKYDNKKNDSDSMVVVSEKSQPEEPSSSAKNDHMADSFGFESVDPNENSQSSAPETTSTSLTYITSRAQTTECDISATNPTVQSEKPSGALSESSTQPNTVSNGLNPEQTAALKEIYKADQDNKPQPRKSTYVYASEDSDAWMDDSSPDPLSEPESDPEFKPDEDSDSDYVLSDYEGTLRPKKKKKKKIFYGPKRPPTVRKCEQCDFSTTGHDAFIGHVNRHNGIVFKCDEPDCKYETNVKRFLNNHKQTHIDEPTTLCDICGKDVRVKSLLKHIARVHEPKDESKLLFCKQCSFKTYISAHLARHQRIHTGEKPHKCPHCDYSSNQRGNLVTHLRTHSGNKPYKCPECDYAAAHNVTLKGHIRATHPEYNVG